MLTPSHFLSALICIACVLSTTPQSLAQVITWQRAQAQEPAWYGGAEAIRIADNVLVYQHENGGWSKNIDMAVMLSEDEKAEIVRQMREERTTIDNDATYTQMRYLARVYEATDLGRFRDGFERGLAFLFEAQYDNGGWPQFYPLRDGYWRHITYNDGAMIGVMKLLRDVAEERPPFGFVRPADRSRAAAAIEKGLDVILKTQIRVDGRLTAWCAQHDEVDLSPRLGRSYELPSISGSESVGIVRYLMSIEDPTPEIKDAIESAVAWFDEAKLTGIRLVRVEDPSKPRGFDRVVIEDPEAPPLWARFYEIGTNRPLFSGRDGVARYTLSEIEHERRIGYSWLGAYAADLLANDYPAWRARLRR